MESCKAGLEDRLNAKKAQETKRHDAWDLVTELAARLVGYW